MNKDKKIAVKQFQAIVEASNLPKKRTGTPKTFEFLHFFLFCLEFGVPDPIRGIHGCKYKV
jgi:hypothetical protein